MFNKSILFFLFLFLAIGCQTDDSTGKEEINLNLLISVPQSGGVVLKANFSGLKPSKITKSGFLISTQQMPDFNNAILVNGKINSDKFENTINTDLVYNHEYFVRAYLKAGSKDVYYSSEASFVSLGSSAPTIKSVTQAHIQDTVTISGNYFTNKTSYVKVLFDDESSRVITSNDSIIKCIVPETVKRFDPPIEIKIYEKKVTYDGFSLFKPKITSVSLLNATFRDELTILGDHFDSEISSPSCINTGRSLAFVSVSSCSITAILCFTIESSNSPNIRSKMTSPIISP